MVSRFVIGLFVALMLVVVSVTDFVQSFSGSRRDKRMPEDRQGSGTTG